MVKKGDAAQQEAVLVELPVDRSIDGASWTLHIDTQLSVEQSNALRQLTSALDKHQARTQNGQRVVNHAGAVRWMLEQLAQQLA